jgi:hypothetical protein
VLTRLRVAQSRSISLHLQLKYSWIRTIGTLLELLQLIQRKNLWELLLLCRIFAQVLCGPRISFIAWCSITFILSILSMYCVLSFIGYLLSVSHCIRYYCCLLNVLYLLFVWILVMLSFGLLTEVLVLLCKLFVVFEVCLGLDLIVCRCHASHVLESGFTLDSLVPLFCLSSRFYWPTLSGSTWNFNGLDGVVIKTLVW